MKTLKHKKTITKRSSFPYKVIGLVLYLLWVQPFGANHLYASERKINIEVNDVTLIDVLKQIEAQSDYVFFYNNADIDTEKKISINMKDANIKDVLDKILNEYSYRINNKKIIITAKRQAPVRTNKISGVVSDDSGQPIIGGNVLVKGLNKGTMTNIDGKYTIDVPDSATTLVISYIGYKLSLIHISEPTRQAEISYAVFCLKKKKKQNLKTETQTKHPPDERPNRNGPPPKQASR